MVMKYNELEKSMYKKMFNNEQKEDREPEIIPSKIKELDGNTKKYIKKRLE